MIEKIELTPEQKEEKRLQSLQNRRDAMARARRIKQAMPPKPKKVLPIPVDPRIASELGEEEIAKIRAEAALEVAAEMKADKRAAMKRIALQDARRQAGLEEDEVVRDEDYDARMKEMVDFFCDLPNDPQSSAWGTRPRITLDGRMFYTGMTHLVTRAQYETLADIQSNCWRHEAEISGKRRNYFNQQRGTWMNANGGSPTGSAQRRI